MARKYILTLMVLTIVLFTTAGSVSATKQMTTKDYYYFTSRYKAVADDGWTYDFAKRGELNRTCVVLSTNRYYLDPDQPENAISFIDIAVGAGYVVDHYDEIKDNIFIDWGMRFGRFFYNIYDQTSDLFYDNITNLHCIARDNSSFDFLDGIQNGTVYNFSGELVDVHGLETNTGRSITWPTGDGTFGDTKCEIVIFGEGGLKIASQSQPAPDTTIVVVIVIIVVVGIVALIVIVSYTKSKSRES